VTYYEFTTEASALAADAAIVTNVAVWLATNNPARFDSSGPALRGLRASDGQVVTSGGLTVRWAVPRMTAAGTWVIPVPTAAKVTPMPLADVIAGISAPTVEDPEWPADPGEYGEGGG
jgi:hypothetical protein